MTPADNGRGAIMQTAPHDGVERIEHAGDLLAIIIYSTFDCFGIRFFTENELSQQLAYMHHPAGKIIEPHVHNPVPRQVHYTQEALFIRRGKLRVDFYSSTEKYLTNRILGANDVILLTTGGHGFEVLE